ncbi:MAG: hypothetical protein HZB16_04110 [Armatimonadetes bacterium]|nr:hypothetical protein [Armatimonadota bacterium]
MEEFAGPESFQLGVPDPSRYAGQRRAPEDCPVPNALRAAAEMLDLASDVDVHDGWTIDRTHTRLMAASGLAFDLWWPPLEGQMGRTDTALEVSLWGAELVAGAAYLGFNAELLVEQAPRYERAVACLLNGWPLIVFGQPEPHQFVLVTGYEDEGYTLIGFLAEPGGRGIVFGPDQRLHLPGGLSRARALGLFTDWSEPAPEVDRIMAALRHGAELMSRSRAGAYLTNQALFDAWAEALETGEDALVHQAFLGDPLIWELAERRWYGSLFLKQAAEHRPDLSEPLLAAAACFQAEHDLMYEFNRTAGGVNPGDPLPLLVERETRPKLAAIVRAAQAKDAQAAGLIARAADHS